jgi:signal transduction histidine kinase
MYIANPKNKANIWCSLSAFLFSFGALKEFYLFDLVPWLHTLSSTSGMMEFHTAVYSVMTYIVYNYGAPALLVFACYFSKLDQRRPLFFKRLLAVIWLPSLCLAFIYNPLMTRAFQLEESNRVFWYIYMAYNLAFCVGVTALMVSSVRHETRPASRRQKQLVCLSILPSAWFSIFAIYLIHSLKFKTFFKLWQLNTLIIGLSVVFFIYMAFREGMMGLRLKSENYKWDENMRMINKGALYSGHVLQNETAKIEWCVDRLERSCPQDQPEELSIIRRSVTHLQNFVHKNQLYSGEIILNEELLPVYDIILQSVELTKSLVRETIQIHVEKLEGVYIRGDRLHLVEMLNNLIINAGEAMDQGVIRIGGMLLNGKKYQLAVEDSGEGIAKEHLAKVFEPYFSTKNNKGNHGLGLAYCSNVVRKHEGAITVNSQPGTGTAFLLTFPLNRRITLLTQERQTKENVHVPTDSGITG